MVDVRYVSEGKRQPLRKTTFLPPERRLQRVFVDLSAPTAARPAGVALYIMLMEDDFSRVCWTRLMKLKSDAGAAFKKGSSRTFATTDGFVLSRMSVRGLSRAAPGSDFCLMKYVQPKRGESPFISIACSAPPAHWVGLGPDSSMNTRCKGRSERERGVTVSGQVARLHRSLDGLKTSIALVAQVICSRA